MHVIIFFLFHKRHGFLGTLWGSQMFLITLCVHPIKQLAWDVINTRRSRGLINHPFCRKGQCGGKQWPCWRRLSLRMFQGTSQFAGKRAVVCFSHCKKSFRSSFPFTSSRENLMKVGLSFHTREAQKVPIIQNKILLILMGTWTLVSEWRNLSLLHKVASFFPPNLTQKANPAAVPAFFSVIIAGVQIQGNREEQEAVP